MGVMEAMSFLKGYSIDLIVLCVFLLAGYIGYKRLYRVSLIQLILQLVSILVTYFIATFLMTKAIGFIPDSINIELLVPDSLYYLVQPHKDDIIPFILFIIIYVFVFVVVKSILYVFSRNYEWDQVLFKKMILNQTVGTIVSVVSTILNAYTYVLVFLIVVSFPLFGLVGEKSFSHLLLKTNPIVSPLIDYIYLPYNGLYKALEIYGEEADEVFDGTRIYLDKMAQIIEKDPSRRNSLQEAYRSLIPYIATLSGYLKEFSTNKIESEQMELYLDNMKGYIEDRVLTLENFNYYYNELLNNKIYDRLIKDEAITNEAITLLVNSNLLDDANLKKIKEYIRLD